MRRGRTSTNHATSRHTIISVRSGRTSGASPRTTQNQSRRRPLISSVRAAATSTYQDAAIHNQTRPISRPDVEKSQTTATDGDEDQPDGDDQAVVAAVQEPGGLARDDERGDRRGQAREQRDPLHARERAEDRAADDEHDDPDRARRRFDPFARVEDRTVAGEDLVDDAQVDERVLVHPPVLPAADRDHQRREVGRSGEPELPPPGPGRRGRAVVCGNDAGRRFARRDLAGGHFAGPKICVRIQRAAQVAAVGVK